MKQLLFLWLLVLSAFSVKCQDATAVLQIADEMPKYLTGDTGLYNFIRQNIQYPQLCLDSGIQGKVYLRFVVGADGQIKKPEV
ncbi:MAG: energy transducer TonB, partial [Chitinophagales bacterium]|nr:energy transducer TonB [Chitinophagales bacterium]